MRASRRGAPESLEAGPVEGGPLEGGVRGVILDLGNVLIELRPIALLGGRPVCDGARPPSPADPLERLRAHPVLDLYERGRATEAQFFAAARSTLGLDLPDEALREAYLSCLGDPVPGMAELVEDLRARGVGVVGLTDISPGHLEAVRRYPAVRGLQGLVASCATGHRKPEPGAFRAALEVLGTAPGETLFVDDRPENVSGAAALGLRALLFKGAEALREAMGLRRR